MLRPVSGICTSCFLATTLHCDRPPPEIPSPPFDEVFDLVEVVGLQEVPGDSIAEIGHFAELETGFAISDRYLPRVRAYTEAGHLRAAFGRFGKAPWEFQRIAGIAPLPSGKIAVSDARSRWITVLNGDLTPDTLLSLPYMVSWMRPIGGEDIAFLGFGPIADDGNFDMYGQRGLIHRLVGDEVVSSSWNSPVFDRPYYGSFARTTWTVAGDSVVVMASVEYPATVLDGAGDSIGVIGSPSPRFRPAPDIPLGYFSSVQSGPRMAEVVAKLDEVWRLDVLEGDYLVFTVGGFDSTRTHLPFLQVHTRVELYNRHTGEKLYEDLPLPEGSKVLGGGRYLYVLLNPDLPPWRIAKYRLVDEG